MPSSPDPRSGPRTYRTHGHMRYFGPFATAVFAFVSVPFLLYQQVRNPENAPGLVVTALWIIGVTWILYYVLFREVREVRLFEDGTCQFHGILRRTTLPAKSIDSVKPYFGTTYVVVLRHREGKLLLVQPMTGFHDLLTSLERLNPGIDVAEL